MSGNREEEVSGERRRSGGDCDCTGDGVSGFRDRRRTIFGRLKIFNLKKCIIFDQIYDFKTF